MKKYFVLFFIGLLPAIGLAQYSKAVTYGIFHDKASVTVFGNNVNVRKSPSTSAAVVDQLVIGSQVQVVMRTEKTLNLRGYTNYWYKIRFANGPEIKEGFIWGGLLALEVYKMQPGKLDQEVQAAIPENWLGGKVLLGLGTWDKGKTPTMELRVLKKGRIIRQFAFPLHPNPLGGEGEFSYDVGLYFTMNHELDPFANMLVFEYRYEACDAPNGETYLFLDNDTLIYGLDVATSSNEFGSTDAEIIWSEKEVGKPGSKIKVIYTSEYSDGEGGEEEDENLLTDIWVKEYWWDGREVKFLKDYMKK